MSTILQKFVNSHLIQIRNDEDFQKLKDAATSLSKSEFRKKENIVKYTLTAIDPNIDASELALEKAKNHIEKQSPTLLSHSKDTPRTILRALILEALYTRALNDIDYARIIWYTGSNVFNYYSLGNEKDILYEILQEIGERVEQEAVKNWSPVNDMIFEEVEKFNLKIESLRSIQPEIETFKEKFQNLISHSQHRNINRNLQYAGSHNLNAQQGEVIANLIESSLQKYNSSMESISTQINEFIGNLNPYFEKISSQAVQGVMSVNNRSRVLWWKESLYSPSTKKSYREVKTELLPLVMAFDLFSMVTQNYPVSIDYILKETIRKVLEEHDHSVSFKDFIKLTAETENKEYIKSLSIKINYTESRISLLDYINAIANEEINGIGRFQEQSGIDPEKKIRIDELAVWLFHDLQAYRIVLN